MKHALIFLLVLSSSTFAIAQDSLNVQRIGFLSYWDSPKDIAVQGTMAYMTTAISGLRIIDIADPANPSEVGVWSTHDSCYSVAVSGNYAYVTGNYGHLYVIDVSDSSAPVSVGDCSAPGNHSLMARTPE